MEYRRRKRILFWKIMLPLKTCGVMNRFVLILGLLRLLKGARYKKAKIERRK